MSKKIKEQGFLRKSHQKTYLLDPGSGKNSPRIQGVKKHRIPDLGSAILKKENHITIIVIRTLVTVIGQCFPIGAPN
jgi:hypothetical protein